MNILIIKYILCAALGSLVPCHSRGLGLEFRTWAWMCVDVFLMESMPSVQVSHL